MEIGATIIAILSSSSFLLIITTGRVVSVRFGDRMEVDHRVEFHGSEEEQTRLEQLRLSSRITSTEWVETYLIMRCSIKLPVSNSFLHDSISRQYMSTLKWTIHIRIPCHVRLASTTARCCAGRCDIAFPYTGGSCSGSRQSSYLPMPIWHWWWRLRPAACTAEFKMRTFMSEVAEFHLSTTRVRERPILSDTPTH